MSAPPSDPERTSVHAARGAVGFPAAATDPAALAALARESMAVEWASGNPVPAEWFFGRAPALAADPAAALDVIFTEFVLREAAGEGPTAGDFAARYPAFDRPLRRLLDVDAALNTPPAETLPTTGQRAVNATVTSRGSDGVAAAAAEVAAADRPAMIGRYPVFEAVGRGGQADVFVGVHPTLGREVVIKVLRAGAAAGPELAAEARVLAALDHPHLARVYDLDVADGRPFLVMESIRGRNLADVRKNGPVAPAAAARWVAAAARATDHAHARGVLHLDIKPRNVMLDAAGRAVLIDFGLARVERGLAPPDDDGRVSGTLAYMAPEQARGENDRLGPPADVYGLGGVLYSLLVGADPIPGKAATDLYAKARVGDWDRAALRTSAAPAGLVRACEQALDPDPGKRFASAGAFADAVEAAVRRPRWPVLLATAAAVLLGVAVGLAAWPRGPRPAVPTAADASPPAAAGTPADLRFAFAVYRGNRFHADFPTPFVVGDRARVTAAIPPGRHATLFLLTEAGTVTDLDSAAPEPAEHTFTYPRSADPAHAGLLRLAEPAGTHVFLVVASASGPVAAERLGLRPGERWPRVPFDSMIRVAGGRAAVEVKGRDVEPGGTVADPEGEVVARLTRLLRTAPADATIEGAAFAVKGR